MVTLDGGHLGVRARLQHFAGSETLTITPLSITGP